MVIRGRRWKHCRCGPGMGGCWRQGIACEKWCGMSDSGAAAQPIAGKLPTTFSSAASNWLSDMAWLRPIFTAPSSTCGCSSACTITCTRSPT
ncbi:hypothetical protein D3C76_1244500 [compost metagenome]